MPYCLYLPESGSLHSLIYALNACQVLALYHSPFQRYLVQCKPNFEKLENGCGSIYGCGSLGIYGIQVNFVKLETSISNESNITTEALQMAANVSK